MTTSLSPKQTTLKDTSLIEHIEILKRHLSFWEISSKGPLQSRHSVQSIHLSLSRDHDRHSKMLRGGGGDLWVESGKNSANKCTKKVHAIFFWFAFCYKNPGAFDYLTIKLKLIKRNVAAIYIITFSNFILLAF